MNKVYSPTLAANFTFKAPPLGADDIDLAPDQLALGVIIGQISRYFDASVYAIAAALVFPKLFFPMSSPISGLIAAFAIFALAFVARPLGATLFARVDRRHGRVVKLTSAVLLLCASTVAISLLPGYGQLGTAAIALLVLLRVGQGLASAGVGESSAALRALGASSPRGAFAALSTKLGALVGVLLAVGLFAYSASGISGAEFVAWGWRFPFLVALAVNMVALFARFRLMPAERLGARLSPR
jgi:MFS family permease